MKRLIQALQPRMVEIRTSPETINVEDRLGTLPEELLYLVFQFIHPKHICGRIMPLNSFYYWLVNQSNLSKRLWEYYFKLYSFIGQEFESSEHDFKQLFMDSVTYSKWNAKSFGPTSPIIETKVFDDGTMSLSNIGDNSIQDKLLISNFSMMKGKFYFRIQSNTVRFGCGVGLIKESEMKKIKSSHDHNFILYMRDGSMNLHPGETLPNRVKEVDGKKLKVFHPVKVNDIFGILVNLDGETVTFFINGEEVIKVCNVVKTYPNEPFFLCMCLGAKQQYTFFPSFKNENQVGPSGDDNLPETFQRKTNPLTLIKSV